MAYFSTESLLEKPRQLFYNGVDYFYKVIFQQKLNNPWGYSFFTLAAIAIAIIIIKKGIISAIFLMGAIFGIPIVLGCLLDFKFGLLFTIFCSFFVFLSKRLTTDSLPSGVLIEGTLLLSFVAIILKQLREKNRNWKLAKNEITFSFLLYTAYILLQGLNPEATSFPGYLFGVRKVVGFLAAYFVALFAISNIKFIATYTKFWLGLALLVAIYGVKQELFGLAQFEWDHIMRTEGDRIALFMAGNIRKFSFLSDPTSFGIFMAFSSLVCLILMLGPFKTYQKVILGIGGVLMLMGMAYSGTRTAYAMIPIGVLIFALMTINNRNTLIFSLFFVCFGAVLVYGPIYGNATVNRIRTVFRPAEDASFQVRDNNRATIQPYIHSHPLGGGISTSGELGLKYCPDHYLAGFPPDSGYLRTAIEIGWIGLIITCYFFFTILKVGIQNFYRTTDPKLKSYNVAYLALFFSIIVANYSQESIGQIPAALVFYPSMAILVRLKDYRDV
ncbi:MAG TPA: O-antigen ligase family protein [Cytophagales bacterium]|nr:O-antigen ligase family protein [Cytophagales bacterium]